MRLVIGRGALEAYRYYDYDYDTATYIALSVIALNLVVLLLQQKRSLCFPDRFRRPQPNLHTNTELIKERTLLLRC